MNLCTSFLLIEGTFQQSNQSDGAEPCGSNYPCAAFICFWHGISPIHTQDVTCVIMLYYNTYLQTTSPSMLIREKGTKKFRLFERSSQYERFADG